MHEITGVQITEYFSELTGRDQIKQVKAGIRKTPTRVKNSEKVKKIEKDEKIEVHDFKTVNTCKLDPIGQDQASYITLLSKMYFECLT